MEQKTLRYTAVKSGRKVVIVYDDDEGKRIHTNQVTIDGINIKSAMRDGMEIFRLTKRANYDTNENILRINNIEIHQDQRNGHYGTDILEGIALLAKQYNCTQMEGTAENENAARFFRRNNYNFTSDTLQFSTPINQITTQNSPKPPTSPINPSSSIPKPNHNMAQNSQIEAQIEMLQKAVQFLAQHGESLNEQVMSMQGQVQNLGEEDLNHDYMEYLEEFQETYASKILAIIQEIDDQYIPDIQRKIQYLEERV
jgi:hypothetical protein